MGGDIKVMEKKFKQLFQNKDFPGSSNGKDSACNAGDPGLIPGLGRFPGEGNGNPLQFSCLENPGQRSLAGYSSWGHEYYPSRNTNIPQAF